MSLDRSTLRADPPGKDANVHDTPKSRIINNPADGTGRSRTGYSDSESEPDNWRSRMKDKGGPDLDRFLAVKPRFILKDPLDSSDEDLSTSAGKPSSSSHYDTRANNNKPRNKTKTQQFVIMTESDDDKHNRKGSKSSGLVHAEEEVNKERKRLEECYQQMLAEREMHKNIIASEARAVKEEANQYLHGAEQQMLAKKMQMEHDGNVVRKLMLQDSEVEQERAWLNAEKMRVDAVNTRNALQEQHLMDQLRVGENTLNNGYSAKVAQMETSVNNKVMQDTARLRATTEEHKVMLQERLMSEESSTSQRYNKVLEDRIAEERVKIQQGMEVRKVAGQTPTNGSRKSTETL